MVNGTVADSSTERSLQEIVARKLGVPHEEVPLDRALLDDIGLDSMDFVEIVMEIERTFSPVSVWGDPVAGEFTTLREIAAFIDSAIVRV